MNKSEIIESLLKELKKYKSELVATNQMIDRVVESKTDALVKLKTVSDEESLTQLKRRVFKKSVRKSEKQIERLSSYKDFLKSEQIRISKAVCRFRMANTNEQLVVAMTKYFKGI